VKTISTAFVVLDLAKLITSCKHAYYTGAKSIEDEGYDRLEEWLERLCPQHPILQVVGKPGENYKNPRIDEVMKLLGI
jgi:NAD-dependent DNA ligase